ncbi:hypothetical protein E4U38_003759 [Claviceps purpurea]|nr:hypothetical protein E4U38_003759 [Claviceps purpurea]
MKMMATSTSLDESLESAAKSRDGPKKAPLPGSAEEAVLSGVLLLLRLQGVESASGRLPGDLTWEDDSQMELFYNGLREDVKDEIAKEDRPGTFDEFVSKVIKIDNRLYARRLDAAEKTRAFVDLPEDEPSENQPTQRSSFAISSFTSSRSPS